MQSNIKISIQNSYGEFKKQCKSDHKKKNKLHQEINQKT